MSQEFDVKAALQQALENIVIQCKANKLKLFKDYMPALVAQSIHSIDFWALDENIDISEKCIVGEVGEALTKLFEDRKNLKLQEAAKLAAENSKSLENT